MSRSVCGLCCGRCGGQASCPPGSLKTIRSRGGDPRARAANVPFDTRTVMAACGALTRWPNELNVACWQKEERNRGSRSGQLIHRVVSEQRGVNPETSAAAGELSRQCPLAPPISSRTPQRMCEDIRLKAFTQNLSDVPWWCYTHALSWLTWRHAVYFVGLNYLFSKECRLQREGDSHTWSIHLSHIGDYRPYLGRHGLRRRGCPV